MKMPYRWVIPVLAAGLAAGCGDKPKEYQIPYGKRLVVHEHVSTDHEDVQDGRFKHGTAVFKMRYQPNPVAPGATP